MLFRDIIGQEEIKHRLLRTVKEGRVSHAQLFSGQEGSRKLALALAYVQFMNCKNRHYGSDSVLGDSCGACPSCVKYQKLVHPDLHFIYPIASTKDIKNPLSKEFLKTWRQLLIGNNYRLSLYDWYEAIGIEKKQGIINAEDCGEILRTLSYKSYESEYKVMIIWMVEKLFHAAAPKILKILEEPPDKTLFLLITEKPEQIISTILSRCQLVKIPKLRDAELIEQLEQDFPASTERIMRVVPIAEGNYTKAYKILSDDQEESFLVENFIKWMRLSYTNDVKASMEFISEIARIGRERQKLFLSYSLRIIRGGMLLYYSAQQLARLNDEEREFYIKFNRFITPINIFQIAKALEDAQYHIERNANPNILFMDLTLTLHRLLKLAVSRKSS
jgi:DNA polymerase-3 subunit delta'